MFKLKLLSFFIFTLSNSMMKNEPYAENRRTFINNQEYYQSDNGTWIPIQQQLPQNQNIIYARTDGPSGGQNPEQVQGWNNQQNAHTDDTNARTGKAYIQGAKDSVSFLKNASKPVLIGMFNSSISLIVSILLIIVFSGTNKNLKESENNTLILKNNKIYPNKNTGFGKFILAFGIISIIISSGTMILLSMTLANIIF